MGLLTWCKKYLKKQHKCKQKFTFPKNTAIHLFHRWNLHLPRTRSGPSFINPDTNNNLQELLQATEFIVNDWLRENLIRKCNCRYKRLNETQRACVFTYLLIAGTVDLIGWCARWAGWSVRRLAVLRWWLSVQVGAVLAVLYQIHVRSAFHSQNSVLP